MAWLLMRQAVREYLLKSLMGYTSKAHIASKQIGRLRPLRHGLDQAILTTLLI